MSIRSVKQQSDRGSIKDIQNGDDEKLPPTQFELRLKNLYESALVNRDQALIESLGIIASPGDLKNPVSLYRHREYIKQLGEKLGEKLEQTKQEIAECLAVDESNLPQEMVFSKFKQARAQSIITQENEFVKYANAYGSTRSKLIRSFRRIS